MNSSRPPIFGSFINGEFFPTGVMSSPCNAVSSAARLPRAQTECVGCTLRTTPGIFQNVRGKSPMHGTVLSASNTGCSGVTFSYVSAGSKSVPSSPSAACNVSSTVSGVSFVPNAFIDACTKIVSPSLIPSAFISAKSFFASFI